MGVSNATCWRNTQVRMQCGNSSSVKGQLSTHSWGRQEGSTHSPSRQERSTHPLRDTAAVWWSCGQNGDAQGRDMMLLGLLMPVSSLVFSKWRWLTPPNVIHYAFHGMYFPSDSVHTALLRHCSHRPGRDIIMVIMSTTIREMAYLIKHF